MSTTAVDAVVIGAGPAGLATALVLGRQGFHVIVCDKRRTDFDKPCGEGILPSGVAHLEQLDLLRHLPLSQCQPLHGVRYIASDGTTAEASFREGNGYGVRRTLLMQTLLEQASAHPRIELRLGTEGTLDAVHPEERLVKLSGDLVRTPLVIGADGLRSGVRRSLDPRQSNRKRRFRRWGARRHFHVENPGEYVEVLFGSSIEAYLTPVSRNQLNVALLWHADRLPMRRHGAPLFDQLLTHIPGLSERLLHAQPCSNVATTGPLHQLTTHCTALGVLLVGDAAGYVDAATGEGISMSLSHALQVEKHVVPALRAAVRERRCVTAAELHPFARAVSRLGFSHRLLTHGLLHLTRSGYAVTPLVRVFRAYPQLFQRVLSANMGLLFH